MHHPNTPFGTHKGIWCWQFNVKVTQIYGLCITTSDARSLWFEVRDLFADAVIQVVGPANLQHTLDSGSTGHIVNTLFIHTPVKPC